MINSIFILSSGCGSAAIFVYIGYVALEDDGQWIAEIIDLPVVMIYGKNKEKTMAKAQVIASRIEAKMRYNVRAYFFYK